MMASRPALSESSTTVNMPKTFLLPLRLTPEGRFATTTDPKRILEQQILDLLVTNEGERVMRPEHGADVQGFLFAPFAVEFMATKAAEIKTSLNNAIQYGEVVEVLMYPEADSNSTVRIKVYYRVFEGGQIEEIARTFTGLLDQESIL